LAKSRNFGSLRHKNLKVFNSYYKNSSFTSWNTTKLDNWEDMIVLQ